MENKNYNYINKLIYFRRNENDKFTKLNRLTLVLNKLFFRKLKNNLFVLLSINNQKCINLVELNYLNNLNFFNFSFFFFKRNYLKASELELKGLNYRFTKLTNNLLLDLGRSHFQLVGYPILTYFFSLKKKKIKKILFININNSNFNITINFFWYKLKKVGPYKLKGFQFIGERIKLKEGKKPFK